MNILRIAAAAAVLCSSLTCVAQIFYKVEGNGLTEPSYLLGTHHLAPLSAVVDSIPSVMEAFAGVQQVVGEIDMDQDQMSMAMKMQPFMTAPADSTLSQLLDPKTFQRVSAEFQNYAPMPGMKLEMFDAVKPMVVNAMVAVTMSQRAMPGFDPSQQLDSHFQALARKEGKQVVALETPEQQAELLYCSTPLAVQAEALVEMLDNPETQVENAKALTGAYLAHDLTRLLALARESEDSPEFFDLLLDRRNEQWLTQLPSIFAQAPTMVVVGAGHLAGPKGLVESLRRMGYVVVAAE